MLSRSIRVSSHTPSIAFLIHYTNILHQQAVGARSLRHPILLRSISTTPIVRQTDPIQELYLRELRNYKPTPPSPQEAEAQTKSWKPPRAPKMPDTSAAPADEVQAYASEQVSVTPRAGDEKFEHNFEEMFESWFDEPESEMRTREENPVWEKRQRRIFPPPPPRPEGYKGRSQRSRTGDD
jgi:F-type H+-transporting ATPase subunit h